MRPNSAAEYPNSRAAELYELVACAQELEANVKWLKIIISPAESSPSVVPEEENFRS
jgi:hypothetical protein